MTCALPYTPYFFIFYYFKTGLIDGGIFSICRHPFPRPVRALAKFKVSFNDLVGQGFYTLFLEDPRAIAKEGRYCLQITLSRPYRALAAPGS